MLRFTSGPLAAVAALAALTVLTICPISFGQNAQTEADPLGPPTQRGIRLTPTMVRTITGTFTREVLVRRYELDAAKIDEVSERIARRCMAVSHEHGAKAEPVLEYFLAELAEDDARHREDPKLGENDTFLNPEFCKNLGDKLLPLTPIMRDLVRDIGQDIRPLLPLKQQLKLGADMTLLGGAFDAFEKNLQRWAEGNAVPGENPFDSDGDPLAKDENGQSKALRNARKAADSELDQERRIKSIWESYLKQFKTFYALDPGQCATADSVLRESLERVQPVLQDATWRKDMYSIRVLLNLSSMLGIRWPLTEMLSRRHERLMDPINNLGDEFRIRLDQIPTTAQRAAADARMDKALAEQGYVPALTATAEEK